MASAPLHEQSAYLEATLRENDVAQAVLAVAQELDLPDWYFGAGGVAQTVWNVLHGFVVDVKNEARVHLWYERRFGRNLEPYRSTGDAIATWPTTASSVGVRYDGHTFVVCAPFGLADLISMVARANKTIVTRDVYEEKVARWAAQWPQLTVIPW